MKVVILGAGESGVGAAAEVIFNGKEAAASTAASEEDFLKFFFSW